MPGDFVVENLTRLKNGKVRNSFHLYIPSARFADNKLIGDLVMTKIWPSIAHLPEMVDDGKPVLDMAVYTKNRQYRLPGSTKFQDNQKLPFPSLELFSQCIISQPLPATIDYAAAAPAAKPRTRKRKTETSRFKANHPKNTRPLSPYYESEAMFTRK